MQKQIQPDQIIEMLNAVNGRLRVLSRTYDQQDDLRIAKATTTWKPQTFAGFMIA